VPQPLLTERQIVELFHVIFVRGLFANLGDKTLLAIKGGINLRFFFGSVRFSEDIDFDVVTIAKGTLENRVDRLLQTPSIVAPLKARGLGLTDISKPKQTDTVQRWKLRVVHEAQGIAQHTKIEFSRRETVKTAVLDPVDASIANAYGVPTFPATHYPCPSAVAQKIAALAGRSETQPRDVFDLNVLFARSDAPQDLDELDADTLELAADNASALTYDAYESLVVAYLEPDHAELYASQDAWQGMQHEVVSRILKLIK
jgi:predicted nucleotidyltransferase component of viral defense system